MRPAGRCGLGVPVKVGQTDLYKFKDYTRYAEHCLNMVASTTDQELRCIQREMAAE
jgi:hypothetical protein